MRRDKSREKPTPPRVLIVDDHPAVREALSIRIGNAPDLEVCGQAKDVAEALRLVDEQKPDVAVVDIVLKDGDGIDLIKRIRLRYDVVRILVWSMYDETMYAERALRAGAHGYITKEHATEKIVEAIREILAGRVYLSPAMSNVLLRRSIGHRPAAAAQHSVEVLSDRELEVFRLVGRGMKTTDIAAQLHLSVRTVSTYRDRIREKMNLADGAALVWQATRWTLENK